MSQDRNIFNRIINFFKEANPQQNEKDYENTNFNFQEDEDTKYLKTSSGQTLPYKIFQTNDSNRHPNLLWRKEDQGSDSDYSLIERRFTEQRQFSFVGGDKIENLNDVAWLFRSLEDDAIEHAFIAYRFHDDSYMIQHLSSGGINSAITDLRLVAGNAIKLNPKSITLVHNHPSGQLKASHDDRQLLRVLKGFFNHTDITVEDGIVINLRSGKYLVFDDGGLNQVESFEQQNQEQNNVQVFSFSKQVYVENYNPIVLDKPDKVASFISSQKFGVSDKTEMLVLNNNLEIVGKVVLPQEKQVEKITEILTIYGGTRAILYGNNVTPTMVNYYNTRLANVNLHIEDAIEIKSENAQKLYKSYLEQGLIREVEKKLEFEPNTFEIKRVLTEEEKELVIDFKNFLRDYRNLEAIVTDPRLPVFAEQALVLENKIKEYTEAKKLSFTDYHRAYFLNRSADVISSDRVLIEMITLNQTKTLNMEKVDLSEIFSKISDLYLEKVMDEYSMGPDPDALREASELFNSLSEEQKEKYLESLETLLHYDFADENMTPEEIESFVKEVKYTLSNAMNLNDEEEEITNKNRETHSLESNPYSIAEGNWDWVKNNEKYTNLTPKYAVSILLQNNGEKKLHFIDNRNQNVIVIDNVAVNQKVISDLYAKELEKKTDLSKGLTNTQIDEKQALHYKNYEAEAKKLGIIITPNIESGLDPIAEMAGLDENFFIIENLHITPEQRDPENEWEDPEELTDEQLSKIPDVLHGFELMYSHKRDLALGLLEFRRNGVFFSIEPDRRILMTYLDEETNTHKKHLTVNEVKFINQKIETEKNKQPLDKIPAGQDLFENIPEELKTVYDKWQQKIGDGLDYDDCANFQKECEALGYTFDYGLDAEPFNLRPIDLEKQIQQDQLKIKNLANYFLFNLDAQQLEEVESLYHSLSSEDKEYFKENLPKLIENTLGELNEKTPSKESVSEITDLALEHIKNLNINNQKQQISMENSQKSQDLKNDNIIPAPSINEYFKNYVINTNTPLTHKDIYAFITQAGTKELKKVLNQFDSNIIVPETIDKNSVLNTIVYPIREMSLDRIKELKANMENICNKSILEKNYSESQENPTIDFNEYYAKIRSEIKIEKPVSHQDIYAFFNLPNIPAINKLEILSKYVELKNFNINSKHSKTKILHDIVYPLRENGQSEAFKTDLVNLYKNSTAIIQERKSSENKNNPHIEDFDQYYQDIALNFDTNKNITHTIVYAFVNDKNVSDTAKMELLNKFTNPNGDKLDLVDTPEELYKLSKNKVLKELIYPLRENEGSLEEEFKMELKASFIQSREQKEGYQNSLSNIDFEKEKLKTFNIDHLNKLSSDGKLESFLNKLEIDLPKNGENNTFVKANMLHEISKSEKDIKEVIQSLDEYQRQQKNMSL